MIQPLMTTPVPGCIRQTITRTTQLKKSPFITCLVTTKRRFRIVLGILRVY